MPSWHTLEDSRCKFFSSLNLTAQMVADHMLQCVIGRFSVAEGLPPHLAQGMFKKAGHYDCIMRYSSLTPKLVPDNVPAPRGVGLKVFGVEGEKIWGEDKKTQDFTFNNYPILELRTPKDTCEIADSLEKNWNQLDKFAEYLGKREDAEVACAPASIPRQHSKLDGLCCCTWKVC